MVKAITVRQPWAWAILNAGMRVINTSVRGDDYRGMLFIHAAKACTRSEYEEALDWMICNPGISGLQIPQWRADCGGLVGVCRVVDAIRQCQDPWFRGPLGLQVTDVRSVPFTPFDGAAGFFDVPPALAGLLLSARGH